MEAYNPDLDAWTHLGLENFARIMGSSSEDSRTAVRIVFTLLYYEEELAVDEPERYLKSLPLHLEIGSALTKAGHDVEVILQYPFDATVTDGQVRFRFVRSGAISRALRWGAKRLGRKRGYYEPALRAIDAVIKANPHVVHFHGAALHLNLALLAARLKGTPFVVQYHGGRPPQNPLMRVLQHYGLSRADRVVFTAAAQALPFVEAGQIDSMSRVETAFEISTPGNPLSRADARRQSGLGGDPIFVCASRLHPDKDPLTVLRAFEIIAQRWSDARLYFCYLTDELLPVLRRYVEERSLLAARVHFLGCVPKNEMPAIMGSADFLMQASLREVASYAVVEAMAAGAIPAVTRIPAFEAITDYGKHGILFAPGDHQELARAVLTLDRDRLPVLRSAIQTYFEAHLSYAALARRLETIYAQVLRERHG
jgi:glycosyltransferase involved in cell wall biosynthesis